VSSLATARKNVVHPRPDNARPDADDVAAGRPLASKNAPVAWATPDNVGPISPTVYASLTICGANSFTRFGSPPVSNCLICTWHPALAALCFSTASCTPSRVLTAASESDPVSAPAIAMETGGQTAFPSPDGSAGAAALAETVLPSRLTCTWRTSVYETGRSRTMRQDASAISATQVTMP